MVLRGQRRRSQSAGDACEMSCSYPNDTRHLRARSQSMPTCGFPLKSFFPFRRTSKKDQYKCNESISSDSVASKGFAVGCLPLSFSVCGRFSPTIDQTKMEPAVPHTETKGETIARDLYSQGRLSESELLHILKGEQKFASAEGRPELRDPVTLEPLGEHQYTFIRSNGTTSSYNLGSLIEYFLSTGDFREPVTRIQVSDDDLKRMDLQAKDAGLKFSSIVDAKKNPQFYLDQQQRQDMLTGMDRLIGDCVSSMRSTIESGPADDGQIKLLLQLFPQFSDYFGQLMTADAEYAQQCLAQYISLVEGPPNRPVKDSTGLKPVVLRFLQKFVRQRGL